MPQRQTSRYPEDLRSQVMECYTHCKAYMRSDDKIAWWQVLSTAALFFPLVVGMFWMAQYSLLATLVMAVPAGGLLTRFFALQHDCGHGSLFSSRRTNETVGQFISILTFTPYDHWRLSHAVHHAGSGHLDRRGIGDIETMTVCEFHAADASLRWRYRFKRHPIVVLLIGPPVYFLILQRLAIGSRMDMKRALPGILIHNAALVLFYGALCFFLGWSLVLSVVLPVVLVAAWLGGWLFFVQHQFEETLWDNADEWDVKIAALQGSSHLKLPAVLNWLTCDIGLHHIHHLASRIPNYRLRACLAASPALQTMAPTLTLWQAIRTMHLALWDEKARRLISFREYRLRHA